MAESVHLDLTGVSLDFEPIEPGTYLARVASCDVGDSKSSGNPVVNWQFEIDEEPYEGRKLFFHTSLMPKAIWKFAQTMKALGWTEEEMKSPDGFEFEPDDTIDVECRLVVTQEPYQGQVRNRVQRALGLGDAALEELSDSEVFSIED